MDTGRLPEWLCDLVVPLTTYLYLVPPVRIIGGIMPKLHIDI
jgi:hypothetical protein